MTEMKRILSLLIALSAGLSLLQAQDRDSHIDQWTWEECPDGIKILATGYVYDHAGKPMSLEASILTADGNELYYEIEPDVLDLVRFVKTFTPDYNTYGMQETIYIPYKQMHPLQETKDYEIVLRILDEKGMLVHELAAPWAMDASDPKFKPEPKFIPEPKIDISGSVANARLEMDVYRDGIKGMMVYADLKMNGLKGKKAVIRTYLYKDHNNIKDRDGQYTDSEGNACRTTYIDCTYDHSKIDGYWQFIPYTALELDYGFHEMTARVMMETEDEELLGDSELLSFTMNKPAPQQQNNGGTSIFNFDFSDYINNEGYKNQNNQNYQQNQTQQSTPQSNTLTCPNCKGTGQCGVCKGKGGDLYDVGKYTGQSKKEWITCSHCHGSGKCQGCSGRGYIYR